MIRIDLPEVEAELARLGETSDGGLAVSATKNDSGGGEIQIIRRPSGRSTVKRKLSVEEILSGVNDWLERTDIGALYDEALELARETKSAKGIMLVVSDALDRTAGKPVQQVKHSIGMADVLAQLEDDDLWSDVE